MIIKFDIKSEGESKQSKKLYKQLVRKESVTMENYNDARDEFINGVKRRNPDFFKALTSVASEKAVKTAVTLAYNDAKRTMNGIGGFSGERDGAVGKIALGLMEYFKKDPPGSEIVFDGFHKSLCDLWRNDFKKIDSSLCTYGKAQKIVNMAFKYLYCCRNATDYGNYFGYCHVPLDSVTLEWFCRECRNREVSIKTGNISKWSTIDVYGDETTDECAAGNKKFYTYMFFQKHFREWFASGSTPLQAEFIRWQDIQNNVAAEEFLFGLMRNEANVSKDEIREMSLDEKYNKIIERLQTRAGRTR